MDVLNPMVNEEDLSSPVELPLDRLPDHIIIVTDDKGPDGKTVFRRGLDEAEIPDAGSGHLQGPWNRGGSEGDHINQSSQLFQSLFVVHPKTMLLVDHHDP